MKKNIHIYDNIHIRNTNILSQILKYSRQERIWNHQQCEKATELCGKSLENKAAMKLDHKI